jgi:hypothetical protein
VRSVGAAARSEAPGEAFVSSAKQRVAARRNVRKAAATAKRTRTIAELPKATRTALAKQAAKVANRNRKV